MWPGTKNLGCFCVHVETWDLRINIGEVGKKSSPEGEMIRAKEDARRGKSIGTRH